MDDNVSQRARNYLYGTGHVSQKNDIFHTGERFFTDVVTVQRGRQKTKQQNPTVNSDNIESVSVLTQ